MTIKILNQIEPTNLALQKAVDDGWNQHLESVHTKEGHDEGLTHGLVAGCDTETGEPTYRLIWPESLQLENFLTSPPGVEWRSQSSLHSGVNSR